MLILGYGLVCHRAIKTLCGLIGIKDMHAKVEGNTKNYLSIVRGFVRLLNEQVLLLPKRGLCNLGHLTLPFL